MVFKRMGVSGSIKTAGARCVSGKLAPHHLRPSRSCLRNHSMNTHFPKYIITGETNSKSALPFRPARRVSSRHEPGDFARPIKATPLSHRETRQERLSESACTCVSNCCAWAISCLADVSLSAWPLKAAFSSIEIICPASASRWEVNCTIWFSRFV